MIDFRTQNRFERRLLLGVIKENIDGSKRNRERLKDNSRSHFESYQSDINFTTNASFRDR